MQHAHTWPLTDLQVADDGITGELLASSVHSDPTGAAVLLHQIWKVPVALLILLLSFLSYCCSLGPAVASPCHSSTWPPGPAGNRLSQVQVGCCCFAIAGRSSRAALGGAAAPTVAVPAFGMPWQASIVDSTGMPAFFTISPI